MTNQLANRYEGQNQLYLQNGNSLLPYSSSQSNSSSFSVIGILFLLILSGIVLIVTKDGTCNAN